MRQIFFILLAGYLLFVFPFAYFRHDDWFILGNSLEILKRPSFIWSPYLIYEGLERPWFFRPIFKILALVFYKTFGLSYWMWLSSLLGITIAALFITHRTIQILTGSSRSGNRFLILFCASIHLHFGSLAWSGEGLMNCPKTLLLSLCLYFFVRSYEGKTKNFLFQLLSLLSYLVALGCKESSVFFSAFLFSLVFSEGYFNRLNIRQKIVSLAPFAVISAVYLYYRLFHVPFNFEYQPILSKRTIFVPFGMLTLGLLVLVFGNLLSLFFEDRRSVTQFIDGIKSRWLYLSFFIVSVFPYLGHEFFSPGWFMEPGFFLAALISFIPVRTQSTKNNLIRLGILLVVITLIPVLYRLQQIHWWDWHKGQRQMTEMVMSLPEGHVDKMIIQSCSNDAYSEAFFTRVIGFRASILFLWSLFHKTPIQVNFAECVDYTKTQINNMDRTAIVRFEFPNLRWIRYPSPVRAP